MQPSTAQPHRWIRCEMKRILIVDDHEVVRNGIRRIFEEEGWEMSFGEASNELEARMLVQNEHWDAVLLDISLGGSNGIDVLRGLKELRPQLPILILTMHSEEQYARRAFKAGASGYVTKDTPRAELLNAISKVLNGQRYVSPSLAEKLVVDFQIGFGPAHETLSDREFQVFRLIASGKTVGEIAEMLSLSSKTISTYRARILEKLQMKTNAELTYYAIQNKLVD